MAKKVPHKVDLSVVGLQYRVTMTTRRMLSAKLENEGPLRVKFQREPRNEHDENAIKVILAEGPYKNLHIGYVRRQVAKGYAPKLDRGEIQFGDSWVISLDPEDAEAEVLATVKGSVKPISRRKKKTP